MNRRASTKSEAGSVTQAAASAQPPGLPDIGSATLEATQRVLQWMQHTQTSLVAAMNACSAAAQSALEAATQAKTPAELLQAQNRAFGTALSEASRCQNEALAGWLALQSELALRWPQQLAAPAPESAPFGRSEGPWMAPDWPAALEQARSAFDEAVHQWNAFWTQPTQRSRPHP